MTATAPTIREAPGGTVAEAWERPLHHTRSWPVTRLASWSLTMLLAGTLYVPAGFDTGSLRLSILVLAAAVVTTIGARALFEALGFAANAVGARQHVPVALPAAGLATASMAGAGVLLGPPWTPLGGVVTLAASTATLTLAASVRAVELRWRQALRRVYFTGAAGTLRDVERQLAQHSDRDLVGALVVEGERVLDCEALIADVLATRATILVGDRWAMAAPGMTPATTRLARAGVGVRELESYYEQEFKRVPLCELSGSLAGESPAGAPAGSVWGQRRGPTGRRLVDASVAALLLVVTLPVLLLAAVAISLSSRGGVLYRQQRVGRHGRPFTLVKLRTMAGVEPDEGAWADSQAHRVTAVGRPLRRFRVDELPQLWNVLRGELALIGPRPEQVPIVRVLEAQLPGYADRHRVRPGITGWAQVLLGYGGSSAGALAKLQCDLYYVKRRSLRLDALIVWLTLKAVFAGRG